MFKRNGTFLSRLPTLKPADWSRNAKTGLTRLLYWQPSVRVSFLLIALALLTLFTGCATQSPPDVLPRNPQPPQLSEPIPQNSYSSKARELIESWRKRLIDTPQM